MSLVNRIFTGDHMWGFGEKPVVHVEVSKDPNLGSPKPHIAKYTFPGNPTVHEVPFKPEPFGYSKKITEDVTLKLPTGVNKKRLLVKIWRDEDTRSSPRRERWITGVVATLLLLFTVFIACLAVVGIWLTKEETAPVIPVALIASMAVNGATAGGILLARISKWGQPFETSKKWVWRTLFPIAVLLAVNVVVFIGFFDWLLGQVLGLKEAAAIVKAILGSIGLVGTVVAAAGSGALSVAQWTIVEEAQRRFPAARDAMDVVQRRIVVKAPPNP